MAIPFEEIKGLLDIREVARSYGVRFGRNGKAFCPFHQDGKTPNLSFKGNRFKCFSCGASGDVLDMTARLYGLELKEAAKRLNEDFRLGLELDKPQDLQAVRQALARRQTLRAFELWSKGAARLLGDYCVCLYQWEELYAPADIKEMAQPDPRFLEAIRKRREIENLHQAVFVEGDFQERAWFYQYYGEEIECLARRFRR